MSTAGKVILISILIGQLPLKEGSNEAITSPKPPSPTSLFHKPPAQATGTLLHLPLTLQGLYLTLTPNAFSVSSQFQT